MPEPANHMPSTEKNPDPGPSGRTGFLNQRGNYPGSRNVKGHDFSRAVNSQNRMGFSPCGPFFGNARRQTKV
jgi:hypothetical protein